MAKTALCIKCNMEFPSEAAFEAHKAGGHLKPGVTISTPDQTLPPDIPKDALPDAEFIKRIQEMEAKADPVALDHHKKEMEARLAETTPKPKEIKLQYQYIGDCDTCIKPVSTLLLDVSGTHVVVAYCQNCQKQLDSREEKKL